MKKLILLAIGVAVLRQAAKMYNINSLADLQKLLVPVWKKVNDYKFSLS